MLRITHTNINKLKEYSIHLKTLEPSDKGSRFGYVVSDYNIDQLMLQMAYNPKDHELWCAVEEDKIIGWGHLARDKGDAWELAVSVNKEEQRKGVGDKLISEMLSWAKFHHISEVFMHCIEENRVIQHLALKHNLKTIERGQGERTAAIEVPSPTIYEMNTQLIKEQNQIMKDFAKLQQKLFNLWAMK